MKKPLLFLITSFLVFNAFSQDWAPLRMGERYNYQQDSAAVITQTLWADSMSIVNGDSTWYCNRTYGLKADTLQGRWDQHVVFNQPFFLQKSIMKRASGHYQLRDTGFFDVQLFRKIGEKWLFDSARNDRAWIVSAKDSLLWNAVVDSVKSIHTDSGNSLIVSKHHGILYWDVHGRQMSLVGMQGRKALGEQVPMWEDFYGEAYEVGDIMYWKYYSLDVEYQTFHNARYTFTGRDTIGRDSIEITYDYSTVDLTYNGDGVRNFSGGKELRVDSASHPANGWPGQLAWSEPFESSFPNDSVMGEVFLMKSKDSGKLIKSIGFIQHDFSSLPELGRGSFLNYLPLNGRIVLKATDSLFRPQEGLINTNHSFIQGMGLFSVAIKGFEQNDEWHITGYIHKGDTIFGRAQEESFWWPTAIESSNSSLSLQVHPNPAQTTFQLRKRSSNKPSTLRLIDLSGQQITQWSIAPHSSIITLSLPQQIKPGMYLLELKEGHQKTGIKLMVGGK